MEKRAVLVGGPLCGEKIMVLQEVNTLQMILEMGSGMEAAHYYEESRMSDIWEDVVVYEYIGQEEGEEECLD